MWAFRNHPRITLWGRRSGLTPILRPRWGAAAPFLSYQQRLHSSSPSPWLSVLFRGGLRKGREQHFVRQINLLSVSGSICCWGQSVLGGDAAQQIESNQDYPRNVSAVSCKWNIVVPCWA